MKMMKLLIDNGAKLNTADGSGRKPLHWALEEACYLEVAQLLIDRGAEADDRARRHDYFRFLKVQ